MSGSMKYRADIDGLRAIAVTVVVLFHAGVMSLQGGFVGVDIFFVISGFLITGILVDEVQARGTISLSNFYARRIRRLMPAGLTVVIATVIIGHFLYPADGERQALAMSGIMAILFVSNIYFWRNTGYFAESAEDLPLLHTWTLSVEEQFYVAWPLLIIAVVWLARKKGWNVITLLGLSILGISVTSFILAQWMIATRPSAAFYLVFSRAFELGAGAVLALALRRPYYSSPKLGFVLSICGLFALCYSVLAFDGTTPWPGPLSLITVLGTVAVLTGGAMAPQSLASRVLSIRPMVFIGKMSYSWYLWHWPFLVFLHYYLSGDTTPIQRAMAVLLSFVMAVLSYYLIEQPVRYAKDRKPFNTIKGSLAAGLAMISFATFIGVGFHQWAQYELAHSDQLQASVTAKTLQPVYAAQCANYEAQFLALAPWPECIIKSNPENDEGRKIIVWGDSHSAVMRPAFSYLAEKNGDQFLIRQKAGCRPFNGAYTLVVPETAVNRRACDGFNAAVQQDLIDRRTDGFDTLWFISRWPPAGTEGAEIALWKDELLDSVIQAQSAGYKVTVFGAPPQFAGPVPRCVARHSNADCLLATNEAVKIQQAQNEGLKYVELKTGAELISLFDLLCEKAVCPVATERGDILYKDDNHLSVKGAEWIGAKLYQMFISHSVNPSR